MNTHILSMAKLLLGAFFVTLTLFATALTSPATAAGKPAQTVDSGATSCAEPIAIAERLTHMPGQLLTSVALAESGKWDPVHRAKIAWPWTVTSGNDGRYFPTKAQAIAWVKTLHARGVRNIDVGCMQVNLMHHPDAFRTLDEAFDPIANVAYGAAFLMELFRERKSWPVAIGLYHSATPALHFAYRQKVQMIWNEERRRAYEEQRQAAIAAYQARRAQQIAEAEARAAEAKAREEARRVAMNTPFVVSAARN